jgi:hypothetical protein
MGRNAVSTAKHLPTLQGQAVQEVSLERIGLNREALGPFEMSVTIYQSIRRNSPEDLNIQIIFGLNLIW